MQSSKHISSEKPPSKSKGFFTDVLYFLLHKPETPTLIKFDNAEDRKSYNIRVMQRIGIDPNEFSVLNIHKIGVEAPVSFVFKELMQWSGDSTCWPNHIAKVDRIESKLGKIRILPLGWNKYPFNKKSFFGFKFIPLFELNSICIKDVPDPFDFDNARYLLYRCSGGYPIGIFMMYVRSSIAEMGEKCSSQLLIAVGFNFYGNKDLNSTPGWVNKIWESVHNRVTANVLIRMKQLGEWRIGKIEKNK